MLTPCWSAASSPSSAPHQWSRPAQSAVSQDRRRKPADPTVDWNGIALAALPYGSTLLVDTFRCDSATTGVTFQNQSTGHGFFMSRESCRIFSWMTPARPLDTACLVPCVP